MQGPTPQDRSVYLGFRAIFRFIDSENGYIEAVVERAIDLRDKVSNEARRLINSAIREYIKVDGYKNTDRAPVHYLKELVPKKMWQSDKLAGAVLKVWAESCDELRDVIVKHLDDMEMTAEYPDFSVNQFQGVWSSDAWRYEIGKILERHDEFDKNDIALMLCYVSGKIPEPPETKDDVLSQTLEYLRSLPANAPEWEEVLPVFVESVQDIRKVKKAQYKKANNLDALIAKVRDDFSSELAFLEKDIASWSAAHLSPDADLSKVLRDTENMQFLLTDYQSIHKLAPVRSEDLKRRSKREKLENRLLPLINRIDQFMAEQGPDDNSPAGIGDSTGGQADSNQGEIESPADAIPELHESEDKAEKLRSKIQSLKGEIKSLQSRLSDSQRDAEKWKKIATHGRQYYDCEKAGKEKTTSGENKDLIAVENVNDAVELAKEKFQDKLLFQLNAKSQVKNNPFNSPIDVFKALEWLGTTYYDSQIGKINQTDLDISIRETCGWSYKPGQNKNIVSRYKDWYTTRVDKTVYRLQKHIGTGSRRDKRHTIRIAFDWDETRKQVIVGFIGEHQKTIET